MATEGCRVVTPSCGISLRRFVIQGKSWLRGANCVYGLLDVKLRRSAMWADKSWQHRPGGTVARSECGRVYTESSRGGLRAGSFDYICYDSLVVG